MFCTNCGQKLSDDVKRCPSCGTVVITQKTVEDVAKSQERLTTIDNGPRIDLDTGCIFFLACCINPLYWHAQSLAKQAKEAAMLGDNALSEKMRKKSGWFYVGAIISSCLLGGVILYLILISIFLPPKKYQSQIENEKVKQESRQLQNEMLQLQEVKKTITTGASKLKDAYAARTASLGEAEEIELSSGVSSIRGEMRHGALGGYVLQLWNTTDKPLKCEGVLNNPKLKTLPKYQFLLYPKEIKPQELGAGQFKGRRILKDCTVTVTVLTTGETHTYKP